MTKLLVSVRDAAEADIALAGGADLIDVKEPSRGPLGAADAATIRAVVAQVAGRAPVSAALGELPANNRLDAALASGVRYAKFGLAGCAVCNDWTQRWQAAIAALPAGVVPVAVVYADWQTARAPAPFEVLSHARDFRCGAVLVDTFDKTAGPLTRHLALAELAHWVAMVRGAGMLSVLAGGLRATDFDEILPLAPDYVGVRGAACVGDRTGTLDAGRVKRLAALAQRGVRATADS